MRHKGYMLMAVFALFLGCVAPVWAFHTADPLEETYAQHVFPYFNVNPGFVSIIVFADTSFAQFSVSGDPIHLFFFDQSCTFRRDKIVKMTTNGIAALSLNDELGGILLEGVAFADSGFFATGNPNPAAAPRFIAYLILINLTDNTLTRIDTIPFSPGLSVTTHSSTAPFTTPFTVTPGTGHWTRYDAFNTLAVTLGDSTGAAHTPAGGFRTTLTFFNAVGGGGSGNPLTAAGVNTCTTGNGPCIVGERDTLREFLGFFGFPRVGDWVTLGTSGTSDTTAGSISLDAFDANENHLQSAHITLRCFERLRLGSPTLFPILGSASGSAKVGHIVAQSDPTVGRDWCQNRQCGFSAFQETVLESTGTDTGIDPIFSGYWHHSAPLMTIPTTP